MKKVIGIALIAATLSARPATAATALEYAVHAQLPQGQSIAATVRIEPGQKPVTSAKGRDAGPVLEAFTTAQRVAQAAISGERTVQVMVGPGRTCVDLSISRNGDTVTAQGNVELPPPPPSQQDRGPGGAPPPPRDASIVIRVTATIAHQTLASAHGEMSPANDARGPRMSWTLEKVGE